VRRRANSLGVFGGGHALSGGGALGTCSRGNVDMGDTSCLDAIYQYVISQRPKVLQFPAALPLIQSFESWYQGLSWIAKNVMSNDTFDEAVRRRDALNKVIGEQLPDTWIPADAPQTSPPVPPPPPLGIPWWGWALGGVGVVAGLYALHEVRMIGQVAATFKKKPEHA